MRTSINFSAFTQTTYYAVGKEEGEDKQFDLFIKAVKEYEDLTPYIESQAEESVMFRIPNEDARIQMLINRICMLVYNDCVYNDGKTAAKCKKCEYKSYCDVIGGLRHA